MWGENGTAICTTRDPIELKVIGDGAGGAIVVWSTSGSTAYVFAQKVNSTGDIQWNPNGVLVTNGSANHFDLRICSDEAGGFIASWIGDKIYHVFAQRINSTGDPMWTIGGVAVSGSFEYKMTPRICSDGSGGAIINWINGPNDYLYCQRINSTGDVQWGVNGMTVTSFPSNVQPFNEIESDGAGGAYIAWSELYTGTNIYVQHITSSGARTWSIGKAVGIPNWNNYYAKMCSDGAGGVFVIWKDNIVEYIRAQRLLSNGNLAWSSAGVDVCKLSGEEYWYEISYDGFGGAFIVWPDFRSGDWDIYSQGISATGELRLEEDGKLICSATGTQKLPELVNDGEGGVFITWQDYRSGGWDVYAQCIENERPTSNSPANIITSIESSVTINWRLYDYEDYSGGEYRVIANNTLGNFYVWRDWTSWSNNTPLNIPINRTATGIFNYTIEYRDKGDKYGEPSNVIVSLLPDNLPTSSHPSPISTGAAGSELIPWILYDDYGGGQYRVLANDTNGDFYVRKNWSSWTNDTLTDITIDRNAPGIFNYTIEYYDMYDQFGVPDTVIVTIMNELPISSHPDDRTIAFNQSISLGWTLSDDFGGGKYRILVHNSNGGLIISTGWIDWSGSPWIQVPVDNQLSGTYNYTIEFYDAFDLFGIPDSVVVTVGEQLRPPPPGIPMGDFYLYFTLIGILTLIIVKKRKIDVRN